MNDRTEARLYWWCFQPHRAIPSLPRAAATPTSATPRHGRPTERPPRVPRSRGRQGGGPGWEDTEDTLGKPLENLRILQIDRVYICSYGFISFRGLLFIAPGCAGWFFFGCCSWLFCRDLLFERRRGFPSCRWTVGLWVTKAIGGSAEQQPQGVATGSISFWNWGTLVASKVRKNIWWFPKIGLPPVIIHFERWDFP